MHKIRLPVIGWLVDAILSPFRRPPRQQVAALVWRPRSGAGHDAGIEVLTITTRRSGRWSIPRGWPISGMSYAASAAQEAWEEAGIRGTVEPRPLGTYSYAKSRGDRTPELNITVTVFALALSDLHDDFPEAGQRKRQWLPPSEAAALIHEAELAAMIRAFTG